MDEPFGALDPFTRAELQREFAGLTARLNKTIVFVTHDIREAFALASRIGLFKDGPSDRARQRRTNSRHRITPKQELLIDSMLRLQI